MIKLNGFYWINILFNLIKNSIWILNFSWQLTSLVQQVLLLPGHRQVSHNTTLRLIMEGMWKTPGQWNKDTWIVVLKSIKEGSIINQKAICLAKCHGICWENHLRFLFDKNYSRIKQWEWYPGCQTSRKYCCLFFLLQWRSNRRGHITERPFWNTILCSYHFCSFSTLQASINGEKKSASVL
jgi:hypothetical protein